MRTLQTCEITLLSCGDDNIESHSTTYEKNVFKCSTLKYTIDLLVI